jgi:hypothetical protein
MELMEELSYSGYFDINLAFNQLNTDWLNAIVLASTMVLVSESHETHDYNLLFDCSGSPQIYFTTGGLVPISSSWRQAAWGSRPEIFFFNTTLAVVILMKHSLWRKDGFVSYSDYSFLFNNIHMISVRTSQETYNVSITKIKRLMLFSWNITIDYEDYKEHIN